MKSRFSSMLRSASPVILLFGLPFVAEAQIVTNLHLFSAGSTNGDRPNAALIQGSDGNFYGTTRFGGSATAGTVFRISPGGAYTNLYSFGSIGNFDGWQPLAALVQGSDGNFYGTTSMQGTNSCKCGNVFRISPGGSYTNLHYFSGLANDGGTPSGALIQASDGNFYGTAQGGGAHGAGVVFRISPGGDYTNLYSFGSAPADGARPLGGLVQGSDGNFYGTTFVGGSNGFGTVFRISPSGSYTILHRFAGGFFYGNDDGHGPYGALVQGNDGNFYGTTGEGGTNTCSCGVVFRITPNGNYTTIYSFRDYPDGSTPEAGLVLGSDGNFYGTTYTGGTNNVFAYGTVFRISPGGQYASLYSFGPSTNRGSYPQSGLVQGSDGNFYGTTYESGTGQRGTVFKLFANLPSPANQINGVSIAGTNVAITVASVAGETYQLQYTTDLTSGNWSNVPGAAATNSIGGPLTVTDLGGALSRTRYYRLAITP